jgi:class 3 adenylate cyclase
MPGEVGQATYELGELQLRRGDLAGAAEAFRRAVEAGAEPQPGLALLRLAEGKPDVAVRELTRTLADVPHDRVERARLLPAFVEVAVAAKEREAARAALEELAALAALYRSDALTATACWARGLVRLADGDPASAVSPLREAVRRWHSLDAPYESARARTALAEAYQATEDDDSAATELEAARAIFERLGAKAAARRAAELLRGDRPDAVNASFLFSDICGSTNLVEAIGDSAWLDLVHWHDRTLRALFGEHGGEEVDHAGDGFFVAFPDAASAVGCAVAIQQALAQHRRHHGFAPPVRIGVHTTQAIQVDRGYRGKGIHAAARIGAVAAADEVVASREAAEAAGLRFPNRERWSSRDCRLRSRW